ncbi:hypothetical protein GLOIN_2v1843835 [Rhizophagus irregularis DAOM 181602=DAOM 197198]|nr:hypothetical protein GLOIN_2v1843835 [Rhizophagus irregularis DAOM 181602=DAOM 197198]
MFRNVFFQLSLKSSSQLTSWLGSYGALYSSKDILKLRVDKNETVSNFVKTIKKSNVGLDNTKFLKVDLSSDELSDRLALLEADPFTNIKKTLNGEELNANKTTILEYFDTGKYYIVIVSPFPRFTLQLF